MGPPKSACPTVVWDTEMKAVNLPKGESVPALGIGTWRYGEDKSKRADEMATLRLALDLGVTLIDTAEMYGKVVRKR